MPTPRQLQTGTSIVELMIAATLGLLISVGVSSVYIQGTRNYAQDDSYQRMIENGRFALELIARDLRMISFWGELLDPATITTALTVAEDCGLDLLAGGDAVQFNNNTVSPAVVQFDLSSGSCPSLTGTVRANSNQLALKHTDGTALVSGQEANGIYLRTNGALGSIIQYISGTTPALPAGYQDWQYVPHVYFVRDESGVPHLCRLSLSGPGFGAVPNDECLAEGVEQMYIQFGLDSDNDGIANQYKSNPSTADMDDVVTARIHVLVRASTPDPQYVNSKIYVLGDVTIAAANDNFYRRVFSTTLLLRNPVNMAALQ